MLAFLPRLTADGFTPIRRWGGGEKDADGAFVMPWPVYDEVVKEFFEAAGQDCWMDFDYVPIEAGRMLEDHALVRRASLDEIKTMLTYCVRGERFSEGHWGAMIEERPRAAAARAVGGHSVHGFLTIAPCNDANPFAVWPYRFDVHRFRGGSATSGQVRPRGCQRFPAPIRQA